MNGSLRTASGILLACAVLAGLTAATGCARQDAAPTTPAVSETQTSYSGPYPLGVAVGFGQTKVTLESVEVSDLQWPYQDASEVAPEGRRWVYVDFAFDGAGANPAPGGGRFYPQFELVADGKSVPIDVRSSGGDAEAPPGIVPHEHFTFLAPDSAHSLVLGVTPKFAETQTVGFRLW